jgi:hypothetical protein
MRPNSCRTRLVPRHRPSTSARPPAINARLSGMRGNVHVQVLRGGGRSTASGLPDPGGHDGAASALESAATQSGSGDPTLLRSAQATGRC